MFAVLGREEKRLGSSGGSTQLSARQPDGVADVSVQVRGGNAQRRFI